MKLKNTPWKYEAHADGTCEIYATDKRRETGLRWIGAAIDEPTALAIAALPDTLEELERVNNVNRELKDQVAIFKKTAKRLENQLTQAEKERDELKDFIIKLSNGSGFLEDTIERLQGKAQQLLTPKE